VLYAAMVGGTVGPRTPGRAYVERIVDLVLLGAAVTFG
jgi:hypothetical protein